MHVALLALLHSDTWCIWCIFFKTSYHFIAGNTEGNKKVCSCILNKIIEDPLSGSCPNLSYADVNGPVANFNPTGSPYALATTNCCNYYYNYLLKYNYCVIFIYIRLYQTTLKLRMHEFCMSPGPHNPHSSPTCGKKSHLLPSTKKRLPYN